MGELVPEDTFTHSHLCRSSIILNQLPPSTTIHSILPVQFMCRQSFCTTSLQVLFGLAPSTSYSKYVSSPKHCLCFAAHAHSIATCFAVVPRLCHLTQSLSLNSLLWTLSITLTPHIHLTIIISACWSATSFSFLTQDTFQYNLFHVYRLQRNEIP